MQPPADSLPPPTDTVDRRIAQARRRVMGGRFGRTLAVGWFVGGIVAAMAMAAGSFWDLPVETEVWQTGWITAAVLLPMVVAAIIAFATAPSVEQTAQELDARFGLQQRLSSSILLPAADRDTAFGRALIRDANDRAAAIDVADQYDCRPSRVAWLPVAVVPVLAIVLLVAEPVARTDAAATSKSDPVEVQQIQTVAKRLKKQIAAQKRTADEKGLEEAAEMFERMEAKLDRLAARKDIDRKAAMIEINDLKQQLQRRRSELGGSQEMRKMMSRLGNIGSGPADKVARAIAKGDFGKAEKTIRQLAGQMKDGSLSKEQKQQLQKQAEQMAKAVQKQVEDQNQKQKALQQQIDQAKRDGRSGEADRLQQQLNDVQQKQSQMDAMQKMAESLQSAADAMKQGDASEAAEAMEQMADQLGQMQSDMEQLEDLKSSLQDLSQAKQQMRCQNCGGQGCQNCRGGRSPGGNGDGDSDSKAQGREGRGAGQGDRDEAEGDTNTYKTQVRGDVKKGRTVVTGFADGPNRKGTTRQAVRAAIESAIQEAADPTESQNLPRVERDHAREYFDRLRRN